MSKIIYFFIFCALLIVSSCSDDILDKQPYSQLTSASFYSTPDEINQALTATYDILQREDWNAFVILSEWMSDNCTGGGGVTDGEGTNEYDEFFCIEQDLNINYWQIYYVGIKRANLVIENINKPAWKNSELSLKERYLGEAYFLRAFFYFRLALIFENIPLITHVLAPEDASSIGQATPDQTYQQIAADLKAAIEKLPSTPFAQMSAANYGRVTKWASEAMLARVWLFYTGYYKKQTLGTINKAEVTGYIDDIIDHGGFKLLDNYEDLWLYSSLTNPQYSEYHSENIFSVKYTYQGLGNWSLHDGSRWQVMVGARNINYPPYAKGWSLAPVNQSLYDAYDTADTRRDGTIIYWDKVLGPGVYDVSDMRHSTGFGWRKYCPLATTKGETDVEGKGGNFMIDNYQDEYVIRYADVLLMGAELHLGDGSGKDLSCFNEVRNRAFKNKVTPKTSISFQDIMNERRFEFALEGLRYWDLLRHGLDVAASTIESNSTQYPVDFPNEYGFRGFIKIPETQIIQSNGLYKQNPFWETSASFINRLSK
jgi:hypothetical protein